MHTAANVFPATSEIPSRRHTAHVTHAHVTLAELFKHQTEYRFAIKSEETATANQKWLARIVTSVRLDSGISRAEKDVKAASAILLDHSIHRATRTPVNVSVNQVSQGHVAISAKPTNTGFPQKVAKLVIVMEADQKVHSAMSMDSAHVTTMLKVEPATGARKTRKTDISDVWIATTVTTWFRML